VAESFFSGLLLYELFDRNRYRSSVAIGRKRTPGGHPVSVAIDPKRTSVEFACAPRLFKHRVPAVPLEAFLYLFFRPSEESQSARQGVLGATACAEGRRRRIDIGTNDGGATGGDDRMASDPRR
jgi:hypothetical protein